MSEAGYDDTVKQTHASILIMCVDACPKMDVQTLKSPCTPSQLSCTSLLGANSIHTQFFFPHPRRLAMSLIFLVRVLTTPHLYHLPNEVCFHSKRVCFFHPSFEEIFGCTPGGPWIFECLNLFGFKTNLKYLNTQHVTVLCIYDWMLVFFQTVCPSQISWQILPNLASLIRFHPSRRLPPSPKIWEAEWFSGVKNMVTLTRNLLSL